MEIPANMRKPVGQAAEAEIQQPGSMRGRTGLETKPTPLAGIQTVRDTIANAVTPNTAKSSRGSDWGSS